MHTPRPKYKRIALIALAVLVVILIIGGFVAYTKREVFLQNAISKAKAKAKRDYNLDVKIEGSHFTGLSTVSFASVTIVPQNRDSLLSMREFEVGIKLFPLLWGDVKLAELNLENGHLNLTNIDSVRNYDFLFRKKKDSTTTKKATYRT